MIIYLPQWIVKGHTGKQVLVSRYLINVGKRVSFKRLHSMTRV